MTINFDTILDRRPLHAEKWTKYEPDVLPMWVADMDFPSPEPVIRTLQSRVATGQFGYEVDSPPLRQTIVERMHRLYGWEITPLQITFVPNLVSALNATCRAFGGDGGSVLMQVPNYPPFLRSAANNEQTVTSAEVVYRRDENGVVHYEIDFAAFEAAITPQTKLFLLCNPHNPIGRVYQRWELEQLAEICLRHDLIVCADEIHCDVLAPGQQHIPFATISPEIADRCITLMSPSKTFNMPTLHIAYAIAANEDVLKRFKKAAAGFVGHPSGMGFAAAQAAYTECQPWLEDLLVYLTANRDYVVQYVQEHLPNIYTTCPEGTYLAWLDCREANLEPDPYHFFLEKARVGFNNGKDFGPGGEGFVRLNYACPRATLTEALERVRAALGG